MPITSKSPDAVGSNVAQADWDAGRADPNAAGPSSARASLDAARAARSPVVLLLAAVLFLNYVDRGALPTAAHHIKDDLHLTFSQLGLLSSAFFWTYAVAQIPMGWVAERYGAPRVLAFGLALWSVATLLVGAVSGFAMLLVLRLLLGLGESVSFPCTSKILASSVPNQSLGWLMGSLPSPTHWVLSWAPLLAAC
jgi:sugar phosphate permease